MSKDTRVDVVIPAHNEQGTIGAVIRACAASPHVRSVYVMADRCTDDTPVEAVLSGAASVCSYGWEGKGQAVQHALEMHVKTERVMFCDADITGLTTGHVTTLIESEAVGMAIGVPQVPPNYPASRLWAWPWVSGQRVIPVCLVRPLHLFGYLMETQINSAARHANLPLHFEWLHGCKSDFDMSDERLADMERDLKLGRQLGILP